MAAPISLRGDFDGPMLRALVLAEKAGSVTRRLLSLVTIYDGGSRADGARLRGAGLHTTRALGYRKRSARPRPHAHDEAAVAAFKKKSRTSWRRSPRPAASHSNSGSKMKPASVRKTRSRDAGRNAARDLLP